MDVLPGSVHSCIVYHVQGWSYAVNKQVLDTPYTTAEDRAECISSSRKWIIEVSNLLGILEPSGTSHRPALTYKHTNTISGCQVKKPLLKEKLQDRAFQTLSGKGPLGFLISNLSLMEAF